MTLPPEPRNSKAWYLIPIFLGILGGIIMFVTLRKKNPKMARKGMIIGLGLGAMWAVMIFVPMILPEGNDMTPEEDLQQNFERGDESMQDTSLEEPRDAAPAPTKSSYEAWVTDTRQKVWYFDNCSDNVFYSFQVACDAAQAIIKSNMSTSMKMEHVEDFENCMYRSDIDECYAEVWLRVVTGGS